MSVPHILADESSAYYHGYVLAEMSVVGGWVGPGAGRACRHVLQQGMPLADVRSQWQRCGVPGLP